MAMRLEERERRPRRKKRRFGGGLVILALLVVLAAAAYKMTGGLAELHMPAGVPKDNVKTDFAVDLSRARGEDGRQRRFFAAAVGSGGAEEYGEPVSEV
jgi:hypothetical protein